MHILLTGATGFVGGHLSRFLRTRGHAVTLLRRGAANGAAGEYAVPGDLKGVETAPAFPAEVEAVVHLAAANPARGQPGSGDATFLNAANAEGTAALARRSAAEGVRRFIFLSSANVHRSRADGAPISEDAPLDPQTAYAASKAAAERALEEALAGTPTGAIVLRPAPVFGVGGRGTVALLQRVARTPLPLPLEGLGGARSLIAVADLCEAIERTLHLQEGTNETLLLAGGAATPAEIVRALRTGAGRPARLLRAPVGMAAVLARRLGRGQSFDDLTRGFVLDTTRAERTLDWRPAESLATRLQETARETRDAP